MAFTYAAPSWSANGVFAPGLPVHHRDIAVTAEVIWHDVATDTLRGKFTVHGEELGTHVVESWAEAQELRSMMRIFRGLDPVTASHSKPEKEKCNGRG